MTLDANSHRARDIYDNAMLVIALNDYLQLLDEKAPEAAHWKSVSDDLKRNIRQHLRDPKRQKFIPHVYLARSNTQSTWPQRSPRNCGGNFGEPQERSVALRGEWTQLFKIAPNNMEIRIHTQRGSVESFFQDNPALVARILRGIQPAKVFGGENTIAGEYSPTA